jgi:hypothetical protein
MSRPLPSTLKTAEMQRARQADLAARGFVREIPGRVDNALPNTEYAQLADAIEVSAGGA